MIMNLVLHPFSSLRKAVEIIRSQGVVFLLTAVRHQYRDRAASDSLFKKNDVINFWEFVNLPDAGNLKETAPEDRNTINWFIPNFGKGSGGHTTIFRFIQLLERRGFICRIVIVGENLPRNARLAKLQISEWFFPLEADVFLGMDNLPKAKFGIATEWKTAYFLRSFGGAEVKCYFVQDFEPWFYPAGSEAAFAEETYSFGFHAITAGDWLHGEMAQRSEKNGIAFHFAYDSDIFWPSEAAHTRENLRVLFYARPPTERRGFELGMLALSLLHKKYPDMEVFFLGWDVSGYQLPFRHVNFGILPKEKLGEIYREANIGLVLSFSNVSLLPIELMACGVPLVSNAGEWLDWHLDDNNSLKVRASPSELAKGVSKLYEDLEFRENIIRGGTKTAKSTSWEIEGDKIAKFLKSLDIGD